MCRLAALCLVGILLACSAARAQDEPAPEVLKLGIIHTNDIHGHVLPFDFEGREDWGGAARLAAAIAAVRADPEYEWLLLDAGDACPGMPISDEQRWLPVLDCMNTIGYDAMCTGNGEFSWGLAQAREYLAAARFPVLCANIAVAESGAPAFPPYAVFQRGPYRIGVIGLVRESFTQDLYYKLGDQVSFCPVEPVAIALGYYLHWIGCDIIVAVTHQGLIYDLQLAQTVPELNVIVGGHSHTFMEKPERVGNAIVTQDGEWAKSLGVLKLEFARPNSTAPFALTAYSEEFIPLGPDRPADAQIAELVEAYRQQFEQAMSEVVCTNARAVAVDSVRYEENAFADQVADALLEISGADCVLFTGGNFQAALSAGEVTLGDICTALPLDHPLLRVEVSGAKLREMLAWAGTQCGRAFPQVAGMRLYYIDGQLVDAKVGGQTLDDEAVYTVLLIDYLACNVAEFPLIEDPLGPAATGLKQRTAFIDWARQRQVLEMATDGRVVFEWEEIDPYEPAE
ncbi:bifunctional metallophosphatase/5'-nucleotidase [bacterium]|nr:bifunctional metallophosphatase/5'-nucleotidase [bacterium]